MGAVGRGDCEYSSVFDALGVVTRAMGKGYDVWVHWTASGRIRVVAYELPRVAQKPSRKGTSSDAEAWLRRQLGGLEKEDAS